MLEGLFIAGSAHRMAQANRAEIAGERASALASAVRTQNEILAADVEKLFLITQALWTILKEEHGYTEEDLLSYVLFPKQALDFFARRP